MAAISLDILCKIVRRRQQRTAEKDVVENEEAAEAIAVQKVEVVEETTVAKVDGSSEAVRAEPIILTAHVYAIVVAKLDIKQRVAHMLKNFQSCWKNEKMVAVQIKVQKE